MLNSHLQNRTFFLCAKVVLILSLYFQLNTLSAQRYHFENYSLEQNLVQSQVRCIFQDHQKYLWVGTVGGLSKFDGKEFKNFTVLDGLPDNQINDIKEDVHHRLWIASQYGITSFKEGVFNFYTLPEKYKQCYVLCMEFENDSILWVGTDKYGAFKFNVRSFTFEKIEFDKKLELIRDLYLDHNHIIWAVGRSGIFSLNQHTINELIEDRNFNFYSISQDQDSSYWIGSSEGLIRLRNDSLRAYSRDDGIIYNVVRKVHVSKEKQDVWIATKFGVSKMHGSRILNLNEANGLTNANVNEIFTDHEGNTWIGTDGNGLFKFNGTQIVNYFKGDGLESNQIMTFIQDNNNTFWFGSYDNGLIAKNKNEYITYGSNKLNNTTIWCSHLDHNETLWFGTSQGITSYKHGTFKNFAEEQGLHSNRTTALCEDHMGRLWLGVRDGLVSYDNDTFRIYFDENNIGRRVKSIIRDEDILWIGSRNGIVKFKDNSFKSYAIKGTLADQSADCMINHLGFLWVGTPQGLCVFDKRNGKYVFIHLGESYNSNVINSIVKDMYGFVWVGTNNGIFRMDAFKWIENKTLSTTHLLTGDGLPSLECNQNAAYSDKEGFLWFGTSNGVSRIDPAYYYYHHNRIRSPKLQLSKVRLFLNEIDWKKVLNKNIKENLPEFFELPYNQNYLTFDFIGIHYKNPEKVRYRYKLLGFQDLWSPPQKERYVTFSYLPPGDYSFEVQASYDLINWSEPETISFTITPPIWLTWWFLTLLGIILLILAFWIQKFRSNIRKRKLEAERNYYQAQMLELEQQALNASMNRHFIFNSLNSIQYFINTQDRKSANNYLTKFAKLIRKNLDDIQNENVKLQEEMERINLYLILEQMRFEEDFDYKITIDDQINPETALVPSMLLQPFVENSILHGILPLKRKGLITVDIRKHNNQHLKVTIEDNGIGINQSLRNKENSVSQHVSKGMSITEERLRILQRKHKDNGIHVKGPYEIYENEKIMGTRVEIILPLIQKEEIFSDD